MNSESFLSQTNKPQLVSIPKDIPLLLFLTDISGLVVCLQLSFWFCLEKVLPVLDPFLSIFVLLVFGGFYLANTFHSESQILGLRAPSRVILSNLIVGIFIAALIYLFGSWKHDLLTWRSILLPSLGSFTIWAVISRLLAAKWERSRMQKSRWLILGDSESAIKLSRNFSEKYSLARLVLLTETTENTDSVRLLQSTTNKLQISHKLDATTIHHNSPTLDDIQNPSTSTATSVSDNDFFESHENGNNNHKLHKVGNLHDLERWASQPWSGVFVATNKELSDQQVQQLMPLRLKGIPVYKLPQAYESLWFKLPSDLLEDTWFTFSNGFNLLPQGFSLKLKRFVDLAFTSLLCLVLSPLMLVTALFIKLDSPGPILYSQLRTGQNNQPFRVYKFRSMYQDAEKRGAQWATQRDPRITRVGYFIRLSRLDELPQIWNVLKGEMSLIGPRPERPEFDSKLRKEIPYYDLRYLVKPGITGWAQVLYPYGASVEDAYEKLSYDLYYIKNYSLWLDIAIVLKTIRVVLLGKGR